MSHCAVHSRFAAAAALYLLNLSAMGGHSRSAAHTREIADWVANHYQPAVIGESTVYRLT